MSSPRSPGSSIRFRSIPARGDDLERADLRFPLVLKPAVKEQTNKFTAREGVAGRRP